MRETIYWLLFDRSAAHLANVITAERASPATIIARLVGGFTHITTIISMGIGTVE